MRLWETKAEEDGNPEHAFPGGQNPVVFFDSEEEDEDEDEEFAFAPPPRAAQPARPPVDARRPARARGPVGHAQRERDVAGLRRFLEMVRDDVEDEWDSDEMSGDEIEALDA